MAYEENHSGGLEIVTLVLGPVQTNTYLVGDPETRTSVVIDPAWDGELIAKEADRRGWSIIGIWLTHAHFDHFGGAGALVKASPTPIPVALHPDDHVLWRAGGGAGAFGFQAFETGPDPSIDLEDGMQLNLGSHIFEVRSTPGHSPGHVMFLASEAEIAFCGDLIFRGGVGRADLPGGDWQTLIRSIQEEVLLLPDNVRLFSGHGPVTTIGNERLTNPFLTGAF